MCSADRHDSESAVEEETKQPGHAASRNAGELMQFLPQSEHWRFYEKVATLLVKYGRSDLVKYAGMSAAVRAGEWGERTGADAEDLARDLESMGPTFIKVGQLLSTRPDLIPPPYLKALARLQDEVGGFPPEQAKQVILEELGVSVSKAFSEFRDEPMAAASLGQVHFARLHDGRPVAVKVERPGIRKEVLGELDALREIAEFMEAHTDFGRRHRLVKMLEEFRVSLIRELDYIHEARNLITIRDNLRDFDLIVVPSPIPAFTTSRVLTMDYVKGKKISKLSRLRLTEVDRAALVDALFSAYLKQVFVDGFFHADPHPGNLLLTPEGKIALIDLGMVGRIPPEMQETLLNLVLAISEGRGEEAAEIVLREAEATEEFDERLFKRQLADSIVTFRGVNVEAIEVGHIMTEVSGMATNVGLFLPTELTLLGKTLLNLDHAGRVLYPQFKPSDSVRRNAATIMHQRLMKSLSPSQVFSRLVEVKDFVEEGPRKIGRILDRLANNDLSIGVEAIDERKLMQGLQKIANRITLGLLLAALIVGAALIMRIPTKFTIMGYPGIAIMFFLAAGVGGILLALTIVFKDEMGGD